MDGMGFRLQQIKIEGFKGFTSSKTIPFDGKHVFVLGPNSYGKSSLVEAIRWGLFGSTRRPGEVVANQGYTGSCRVELSLERGDGQWTLKRTLIKGVSGGSDADIVDNLGRSHPLREVLPQLESTPTGEGMHIIYAAQSAPLRRPAEDVSPFERTIYTYLGLADVRMVISRLKDFIELQEATEKELAEKVDKKRNEVDSEIGLLTVQRDQIIKNPPWGTGSIPTREDTASKIGQFIGELSAIVLIEPSLTEGAEINLLMREAESFLDHVIHANRNEIETARAGIVDKLKRGQSLLKLLNNIGEQIQGVENELASVKGDLEIGLGGQTIDTLSETLEQIERQVEETALLHDIQNKAHIWLTRNLTESERQHCPLCGGTPSSGDLLSDLANSMKLCSSEETEILAKRDALKHQRDEVLRLSELLKELQGKHLSLQLEESQTKEEIREFLGTKSKRRDTRTALQQCITGLEEDNLRIDKQLMEATGLHQGWKRKLDGFKDEVRFHGLQEQLLALQKQKQQVKQVEDELKSLTLFGDSVRGISEVLKAALNNTLKSALPGINKKLTEAFKTLTDHPAYSIVFIDETILPKLELRVGSDDAPLPGWVPSQVLNGQALSALELVPYFAFSELTDLLFEVYLLLLDDPTQSFDARHIEILIAKLAELGKRIQLIVASHEVDHFSGLLPQYFEAGSYEIIRTTGFSRQNGPTLEIVNEAKQ
ncbi:MAG: hypothetical protein ACETVW_05525 [Dehalococcoidia bacterium]